MKDSEENPSFWILPTSPRNASYLWEILNYDKIKVMKKQFFERVVSHFSSPPLENEAYARLFQQSGPRFFFLSEYLSFDHRTDVYGHLAKEEKQRMMDILSYPFG